MLVPESLLLDVDLQESCIRKTAQTAEELDALPKDIAEAFRDELAEFIYSLVSHYVLDGGKIVVAHAGMKEEMQGRGSGKVREFALYGETTGLMNALWPSLSST